MKTVKQLQLGDLLYTIINGEIETCQVTKLELVNERAIVVNNIIADVEDTVVTHGRDILYLNRSEVTKALLPLIEVSLASRKDFLTRIQDKIAYLEEMIESITTELENTKEA